MINTITMLVRRIAAFFTGIFRKNITIDELDYDAGYAEWRRENDKPIRNLPKQAMVARWVPASILGIHRSTAINELARFAEASGWNPKVIKLRRDLHIIDVCADSDSEELHSVRLALVKDHPFLAKLNDQLHMPKAVKAIYRKEVRLAHKRSTDCWTVQSDLKKAVAAFSKWYWADARSRYSAKKIRDGLRKQLIWRREKMKQPCQS